MKYICLGYSLAIPNGRTNLLEGKRFMMIEFANPSGFGRTSSRVCRSSERQFCRA